METQKIYLTDNEKDNQFIIIVYDTEKEVGKIFDDIGKQLLDICNLSESTFLTFNAEAVQQLQIGILKILKNLIRSKKDIFGTEDFCIILHFEQCYFFPKCTISQDTNEVKLIDRYVKANLNNLKICEIITYLLQWVWPLFKNKMHFVREYSTYKCRINDNMDYLYL